MKRLKIPEKMVERTLWAVWGLLSCGAVLWLLVGSVAYWVKHGWLPADTSGWVQALGSILAIVGAALFPYWHSRVKEQSETSRTEELLLSVAGHLRCELNFTYEVLSGQLIKNPAIKDEVRLLARPRIGRDPPRRPSEAFLCLVEGSIKGYVDGCHSSKWPVYRSLLDDISAAHLWSGTLLHHMFHLKQAVEAGSLVGIEIDSLTACAERYGARLQLIQFHWQKVCEAEIYLKKGGVVSAS